MLKEPPLLTPEQLSRLPPRIQQLHADLLARCNVAQETYPQVIHKLRPRGAQDTTLCVQDTSKHYKEQIQIEEILRTSKDALAREMSSLDYKLYVSRLSPVHFRRDTGCLTVEAPSRLIAAQLNGRLDTLLRRTVATLKPKIFGVQVHSLVAIPGPPDAWDADEQEED